MHEISRIAKLLEHHLFGTLTQEEKEELDAWVNDSPGNQEFMRTRMHKDVVFENLKLYLEAIGKGWEPRLKAAERDGQPKKGL